MCEVSGTEAVSFPFGPFGHECARKNLAKSYEYKSVGYFSKKY